MRKRTAAVILSLFCFILSAQEGGKVSIELDEALKRCSERVINALEPNSKVVILNFTASSKKMSDYLVDELTTYIVNDKKLLVVDRKHLDILQQEIEFQMSGEVDDASAQSIGKKLGAQSIISGSIELLGDFYLLRVRTIAVETAAIQVLCSENVKISVLTAALLGEKPQSGFSQARSAAPKPVLPKVSAGRPSLLSRPSALRIGVTGLLDWSTVNPSSKYDEVTVVTTISSVFGGGFGMHVNYGFGSGFAFQSDFRFVGGIGYAMEKAETNYNENIKINGFELPLLVCYELYLPSSMFSFSAGLNNLFLVDDVAVYTNEDGTEETVNGSLSDYGVNGYLFGLSFGAQYGLQVGKGLITVDMRFIADITDFFDGSVTFNEYYTNGLRFSMSAGYSLYF